MSWLGYMCFTELQKPKTFSMHELSEQLHWAAILDPWFFLLWYFFQPRDPLADPADLWPDPEVTACSREVDDNAFSIVITADVVRVEKMTGHREATAVVKCFDIFNLTTSADGGHTQVLFFCVCFFFHPARCSLALIMVNNTLTRQIWVRHDICRQLCSRVFLKLSHQRLFSFNLAFPVLFRCKKTAFNNVVSPLDRCNMTIAWPLLTSKTPWMWWRLRCRTLGVIKRRVCVCVLDKQTKIILNLALK